MYDKIANDADWQDGMNAFRLQVMKSLAIINEELNKINVKLTKKETTP